MMELHCTCIKSYLFVIIYVLITSSVHGYETQNIYCFFQLEPDDCTSAYHSAPTVPASVEEAYKNLEPHVRTAIENGNCDISVAEFQSIPPVLLHFLPAKKLSSCNGSKLAAVVKKYPYETSLIIHTLQALRTLKQRSEFLKQLPHQGLPKDVLAIVAQSISQWKGNFELDMFILDPSLLMQFPPQYLWSLSDKDLYRFFHFTAKNSSSVEVGQLTKRILASVTLKNPDFPAQLSRVDWLLTGFTADELNSKQFSKDKFNMDFNLLQARAIFKNAFSNKYMTNFDEYLPLLPKLTPELLQKFNTRRADFAHINKFPNRESYATAIQIAEFIIAKAIDEDKLVENSKRAEKVRFLEKWTYTLPPSTLDKSVPEDLPLSAVQKLESHMLSDLQIYYLTGKGKMFNLDNINSILSAQTLLSSLPASQLTLRKTGSIQSRVLDHLLMYLPGNNIPRTISLLNKIWTELDNLKIFTSLLLNKDVNNMLYIVPSWIVRENAESILNTVKFLENKMAKTIQNLPSQFLSVLLSKELSSINWSSGTEITSHHHHNLLLGLTCDHINMTETPHFITIMDHYNQIRMSNNKVFPKNLQYCCLKKLVKYLQFKSNLTMSSQSLINLLEPMEIHAVGGYVLAGLPVSTIQASKFSDYILMSISKLSASELITAVGGNLAKLRKLATAADAMRSKNEISQNGNKNFYYLGNLLWFVAPENLTKHTTDVRLTVESKELDHRLCGTEEHRNAWSQYLISVFGSPDSWSSSVLSSLGDLLIVFSEDQLQNINKSSWIEAADTMPSQLGEVVEWVQPVPFYQVCMSVLGKSEGAKYLTALKNLIRWNLKAVQWQLDTVRTASQIRNRNTVVKPISSDYNPLKPQTKTKTKILNSAMKIQNSKYTLCKDCSHEDDPEMSLTVHSQLPDSSHPSAGTYEYSNKSTTPTSSLHNSSETGNNLNEKELYTQLNKSYVPSSTDYISSTEHILPSSAEYTSSISFTMSSSTSEAEDDHETGTEDDHETGTKTEDSVYTNNGSDDNIVHTNVINEITTEAVSSANSQVTPSKQKLSLTDSANDETESVQDESHYDEDAENVYHSIIEESTSHEKSKRDLERTHEKISCNAVTVVGSLASVALSEDDIRNMSDMDLDDCIETFGKMSLPKNVKQDIWKRVYKETSFPIHMLGSIVEDRKIADMWHISYNFSVPWVSETIHTLSQYTYDDYMMGYLVKHIEIQNTIEDIGGSLSSLGNLICNFDVNIRMKILEQIQYAVVPFGSMKTCLPCLSDLAEAVIMYGGAGDVKTWKPDDVSTLGTIVAGVNQAQWLSLVQSKYRPLSGLQPYAVHCLSADQVKVLDESILSILPPLTLAVISEHHLENLTAEQAAVTERTKSLAITTNLLAVKKNMKVDSGSLKMLSSVFIVACTLCFIFLFT